MKTFVSDYSIAEENHLWGAVPNSLFAPEHVTRISLELSVDVKQGTDW